MAKKPETTELAELDRPNTAVSLYDDYGEDSGAGLGDTSPSEVLIPTLRIVAQMSPQLDPSSPAYMADAKPGMILNTATSEVYNGQDGIIVQIVKRDHHYEERADRNKGPSRFYGIWHPEDHRIAALKKEQGDYKSLVLPSEWAAENSSINLLIETYLWYVIVRLPNGDVFNATIPLQSSQLKKHRIIRTKLIQLSSRFPKGKAPPMFAFQWNMRTRSEKNTKGSWFGWDITLEGGSIENGGVIRRSDPNYQNAKDFLALLDAGEAQVNYEADEGGGGEPDTSGGGNDEEMPF